MKTGVIRPWSEALEKARAACEKEKPTDKNGAPYSVRHSYCTRASSPLTRGAREPQFGTTARLSLGGISLIHRPCLRSSVLGRGPQRGPHCSPLQHAHCPRVPSDRPVLAPPSAFSSQYSKSPDTFESLGLGTQLYLLEVKYLAITFLCMCIFTIPLLCFCYYAQEKYKAR